MGVFNKDVLRKKFHLWAIFLLVLGGLNWGAVGVFKTDLITYFLGKNSLSATLIFILVALSALWIGVQRDSYLPFLGDSVVPCSVLKEKVPDNAELKVRILAPAGRKVLYWASEPSNDKNSKDTWKEAYGGFENAGVAIAESDNSAVLHIRRPQSYTVGFFRKLEPHVHYRICGLNGMMGPVRSLFIEESVEGFGNAFHL